MSGSLHTSRGAPQGTLMQISLPRQYSMVWHMSNQPASQSAIWQTRAGSLSSYMYNQGGFICSNWVCFLIERLLTRLSMSYARFFQQILNIKLWRPKMATWSSENMRRWQPRGLEHAGFFLISINPAWLLNELSRKNASLKANITLR